MANIYVRKSGSDSNNGSTPALAKLTIAGAISASSSDDQIVIGAGIYREQGLTTGSKNLSFWGDITGEFTGDAGEVIWSGLNSTDDVYTACNGAVESEVAGYNLSVQYISFQNFLLNSNRAVIYKNNYGNFTTKNCDFKNIYSISGASYCIYYVHSSTETTETINVENIYISGFYSFQSSNSSIVAININTQSSLTNYLKILNCKIIGSGSRYSFICFYIYFNGTIIDKIENLECFNIFCATGNFHGIYILSSTSKDVYNCLVQGIGSSSAQGINSSSGSYAYNCSVLLPVSAYNYPYVTIVESGTINKANYYKQKLDKISRFSPLLGQGNTTFPTTDIEGNPRPAYGNGTACNIGVSEATSDIIQKESTIKDSGDYSVKVSPCNYFKKTFQVPVTASTLRTVKVKIRIDGTWGTYLPRVSLSGQGMTLSQTTKNSTTGSFEELTVSGTPTTTGIALLTIEAHSPNTDAALYIDTITIE